MTRLVPAIAGVLLTIFSLDTSMSAGETDFHAELRRRMVREQILARGIRNPRVLEALQSVPRHWFVPASVQNRAYQDRPLPIGSSQTISQPYIVAIMTELLDPQPEDTILEIGTGSGYQAAILSPLVARVYSIEIVPELADRARSVLAERGYDNVTVITGDGYRGLPEQAPFDGVILTAAPASIPQPLIDQLAVGARLIAPVGHFDQQLVVLKRTPNGIERRHIFPVRFVPMTGEALEGSPESRE